MIVVVGGGLTGLSAARTLQGQDCVVLEKESEVGGLCRTLMRDGFQFDMTGHLLHFRHPEIKNEIQPLLSTPLREWVRRSSVYYLETLGDYPFQVHTHSYPPEVRKECLLGFIEAMGRGEVSEERGQATFDHWLEATFGDGFKRHFLGPYNRKLWCRDLSELSSDWVQRFIPRPSLDQVVEGALGISDERIGYNATFLYPEQGGISVLANSLAAALGRPVELNSEVEEIDVPGRQLVTVDGRSYTYDRLISTMPLPRLLSCARGLPDHLAEAGKGLDWISVWSLNIGVRGTCPVDRHWIYFPEERFPFYRVGIFTNFSAGTAPPDTTSFYVEVSRRPDETVDVKSLEMEVLGGLRSAGLLPDPGDLLVSFPIRIPCAYVVYNSYRAQNLESILTGLSQCGIESVGRYGEWKYSSMEDALVDGKQVGRKVLSG